MNDIIQLKISLLGTKPLIWRQVLVEKTTTFETLHKIIQIVMGWTNSHLHEFTLPGLRIGQPLDQLDDEYGDELIDEASVTMESVLTTTHQTINYTYDFGESWLHTIEVEKWLSGDSATMYPVCIGGELACPPEDCGGIPGFYKMLRIVRDKRHPKRQEMLDWLGESYDEKKFEQQAVNQQLTNFFYL